MPEQTAIDPKPQSAISIQSLQAEGRTREPRVEAQISSLLHVPKSALWRMMRERDHLKPEWVQEETLVGLLRIWNRNGDCEAAEKIADALLERTAHKITRQVACWNLARQHVEDCIRDIQLQLIEAIFSDERSHEFWEVRFWVCLERRINNVARRYRALTEREWSPEPYEDGDGKDSDRLEQIADPTSLSFQERAEMREALALLTTQERQAFVLYNREQWSQDEIAKHLQVTDRTVRNMLTRAHKRLERWRNEN